MIPQAFIQELLARVVIVDVVGRAVKLRKAGANLQGADLRITVTAQVLSAEVPNIAVMLEQCRGVGITSVATHLEKIEPIVAAAIS